jgi:calcium binding protein 39
VALNCGTVLREAFKHEQLAKIVLYSPVFWSFFDYVETGVFDVAGDAFSTFKVCSNTGKTTQIKELIIRHKQLTADFLSENYTTVNFLSKMLANIQFFKKYDTLLHSPNYVTKRQSVKVCSPCYLS